MKLSKIVFITVIILAIFTVGAVSASDVNETSDSLASGDDLSLNNSINNNLISKQSVSDDDCLKASFDSNLISSPGDGSFTDLYDAINGQSQVTLDKDYVFNDDGSEDTYKNGISISSPLTIDGNGHKIDGVGAARIFSIDDDNVVLKNITFVNARSDGNGGAIYWHGDNGTVSNCSFVNCSSRGYDSKGTIYWDGVNGTVADCSFINCSSNVYESTGGIYWAGVNGTVSNCSFVNCYDTNSFTGAAIYWTGNEGTVADCSFMDCFGSRGAIFWYSGDHGHVLNCSFVNCSSDASGGGVSFFSNGIINNCSFVNCSVRGSNYYVNESNAIIGGAAIDGDSNSIIVNCSFVNCYSNKYGGAILFNAENGTVVNCSFVHCSSYKEGGAIYWNYCSNNCSAVNCSFVDCSSMYGGAIYADGSNTDCSVVECSFVDCSASSAGGAVYWDYESVGCSVVNCSFVECSASYATAIYCGAGGVVEGCGFVNCSGSGGGPLYFNGAGNVNNCRFVNCSSGAYAGAIYFYTGIISNCSFVNCSAADKGGAIYCYGSSIVNCSFINCSSKTRAGAIYMDEIDGGDVVDCSFVNCSANEGGAIYLNDGGGCAVLNCSFVDCSRNSGFVVVVDGNNIDCSVVECSFVNCSPDSGGAIRWSYQSVGCSVVNCSFVDCTAPSYNFLQCDGEGIVEGCSFVNCTAYSVIMYLSGTIANCSFVNCSSPSFGGSISGSSIAIANCSFVNCSSAREGGAIHLDGDDASVTNCSFVNCFSTNDDFGGGAICWMGDNGIVADCSFVNCYSNDNGGAISWGFTESGDFYGVNGAVVNCSFVNCSAADNGGAIYWNCPDGAVVYCSFVNCSSNGGGAIYWIGDNGVVVDCSFVNCSAVDKGGAIMWDGNGGSVANCSFMDCSVNGDDAGAIYWNRDNGVVADCSFVKCSSKGDCGGAVYWYGNDGVVANSTFADCSAANGGGAIYSDSGSVVNCSFVNCSSEFGGAISSSYCSVVNCSFVSCIAVDYAGAVNGGDGDLFNCSFVNCSAAYEGGAVMWYQSGSIVNCSFVNCSSPKGGAIEWSNSVLPTIVANCSFVNCIATDYGGAIYWTFDESGFGEDGIVTNCTFENCSSAKYGGAIYWDGHIGTLANCSFENCSSNEKGGAIYWWGSDGTVANCSFVICSSNENGGAIYWDREDANVTNCSFVNCSATGLGGSIYLNDCGGAVENSNFTFSDAGSKVVYSNDAGQNVNILGCRFDSSVTDDPADVSQNVIISHCYLNGYRIDKIGSLLNVTCENIRQCYDLEVNVTTNITSGRMNVTIAGRNYTLNITEGRGSLKISNLAVGDYVLNVSFTEKSDYAPISTSKSVSVTPAVFEDLQVFIDNAVDILTLNCDFYGNGSAVNVSKSNFIIDGAGHTLDANGLSAIFNVTGTGVTLRNFTFINASCDNRGGAIYWNGENGSVLNCSFADCRSGRNYVSGGGAILWNATSGKITDCNFTNCSATWAGAIELKNGTCNISDCRFVNCSALGGMDEGYGGAICLDVAGSVLTNCSFVDCYADRGGAVTWRAGDGLLANCSFVNCSADWGGAVYWNSGDGSIVDCSFVNCSSVSGAGAIAIVTSGSSVIRCSFVGCFDNGMCGGAIDVGGDNCLVADCSFVNCSSAGNGGAISWESGDAGSVVNCSFVHCSAELGGAIYWHGYANNGSVVDCSFVNCSAADSGGAIYFYTPSENNTITDCSFTDCSAANFGGAIFWNESDVNCSVANCSFERCCANFAGAVSWYMGNHNSSLVNCSFVDCSAVTGSIVESAGENFTVSDCSFTGCTSGSGAIWINSFTGTSVVNCSFVQCFATNSAGAINCYGHLSVVNCSFTDCSAVQGGAIYFDLSTGSIVGCSFVNCSAAENGGAIYWNVGTGSVANCNFVNCSAAEGGSIYLKGFDGEVLRSSFTYSDVESIVVRAIDDSHDINVTECMFYSGKTDDPATAIYGAAIKDCYLNGVRIDKYATAINIEVCDVNYTESEVVNFTIVTNASQPVYTILQIVEIILERNGTVLLNGSTNYGDEVKSYDFPGLAAGTYNVTVIFRTSGDYAGSNVTATFNVLPVTPKINVTCQNTIREGMKLEVSVSTDFDSGIIQLSINGNNYNINITDGKGALNISGVSVGNHTLTVAFAGNDNYNPNSTAVAVRVIPAVFEDLQDEIDAASGALILTKDYLGNGSMIAINKDNFVIDGQGHTLDANDMSGIFEITGNNVTIRNINLINANSFDYVIDWSGSNGRMIGCDVRYSSGRNKTGSVYWQGADGIVSNCSFVNCSAQLGGAIYWDGDDGTVEGCSFTNCSAVYGGGAVYWDARNGMIRDSIFTNCSAKYGGAIYGYGDFGSILDCAYVNCIASVEGNTVYVYRLETSLNIEFCDIVCGESEIINVTLQGPWSPVSDVYINIILGNGENIVGNESVLTDSNGAASYAFANLAAGTYNVTAIFHQYGDYAGSDITATFTVSKIASSTGIIATSIDVGQTGAVNVTLRDEYGHAIAGESINIVIYDSNAVAVRNVTALTNVNGVASYELVNMSAGSYNAYAFFYGTDTYVQSDNSSMFTVSKVLPSINVTSDNIYFGENETVSVILPSDATGTVKFYLYEDIEVSLNENMTLGYLSYDVSDISDGVSLWTYSGLSAGKYRVDVTYMGDDKYVQVSSSAKFTVSKVNSQVNLSVCNIDYGENETIAVYLPSDATGNVSIYLNGAVVANVNVEDAMAYCNLANLNAGTYEVFAAYSGDEKYNPANASDTFEVAKIAPQMVVECEVGIDVIEITVRSSVDGNMSVQFKGMSYPVLVSDGIGHVSVDTPVSGNYTVTVTFQGDGNHNSGSNSTGIYVALKPTDIILTLNASSITLGESVSITANLLSFNRTVGNASIDLLIGNAVIGVVSGVPYDYVPAMAGEYTVVARFNGDERYLAGQANRTFSVAKMTPSVAVSAADIIGGGVETVNVTLPGDATGNVNIVITKSDEVIGNVSAVINSGNASYAFFGLAPGEYGVDVIYPGDSRYVGASASTSFRVSQIASYVTVSAGDVYYGVDAVVSAGLPDDATGGVAIVIIKDDVVVVNMTAVIGNGTVSRAVSGLAAGDYVVNVIYYGDDKYIGASNSTSFKVSKVASYVVVSSADIFGGEDATVYVALPEDATGSVGIVIIGDGKVVVNRTAGISNGKVSSTVSGLNPGDYVVNVAYYGDGKYVGSSNSTSFNVGRISAQMTVSSSNILVGHAEVVNVYLPDDATGTLAFAIFRDGVLVNTIERSPMLENTFNDLAAGEYVISVSYSGNAKYFAQNASTAFTVSKFASYVTVSAGDVYYGVDVVVSAGLPDDATGSVAIVIIKDDVVAVNKTAVIGNGAVSSSVSGLAAGDYVVNVAYYGDGKYIGSSNSTSFRVSKVASYVVVSSADIFGGEDAIIYAALPEDATGSVGIVIIGDGKVVVNRTAVISSGKVSSTVSGLNPGDYVVNVAYYGDGKYIGSSNSTSFNVGRISAQMTVSSSNILVGQAEVVNVYLPDDATGTLTFAIFRDGVLVNTVQRSPILENTFNDLAAGEYVINVSYSGSAKYFAQNASTAFTVSKLTPEIVLSASEIGWGEVETVGATITKGTTGNIVLMLSKNGVSVTNQTVAISNGAVSYRFQNLAIGLYNFTAVYAGDSIYSGASSSTTFRVKPSNSFADLQTLINNAGDVLTLVQDYYGTGNPLVISKEITIDGAGHTIDANLESRILNIEAGVTLKNIRFANGYGSAIYSMASGVSLINCIFEDCVCDTWGGALYMAGGSCLIENCSFFNNHAGVGGGAVYLRGTSNRIVSSLFEGNYVAGTAVNVADLEASQRKGGDVLRAGMYDNGPLSEDVIAPQGGGAVYDDGRNLIIDNCTFTNNTAEDSEGGAVRLNDNANIRYSTFKDNKASTGSAVWCKDNAKFTSNTFMLSDGEQVDDVIAGVPSRDVLKASNVYTEDEVMMTTPDMELLAIDIVIGENETVYAHLPGDAGGNVTFYIYSGYDLLANGTGTVVNGFVYYDFANFTYGVYKVEADYTGDDRYYDTFASTYFVVRPNVEILQGVIVEEDGNIYMEFGNVTDLWGITIKSDGRTIGSPEIVEGILNFTFPTAKIGAGNHTVTFIYEGDVFDANIFNYWDAASNRFRPYGYNMYVAPIVITIEEDVLGSGNDGVLVVELPEDATGTIEVFINEVKYTIVDVVGGIARIDLSEFKDGDYKVTFAYSGDSKYSTFTKESVAKVKNDVPSSILADDMIMTYSASGVYTVCTITKTGKAVGGVTVTFSIDGKALGKATTNGEGFASIGISALPGIHKITASISGASTTKTLNVKHVVSLKKAKVKSSAKKLVLTASLAKVNGKFLKGKKIVFKFNGKKFAAKTNKKGVAKVTIKQNVLKKLKAGKKIKIQATYLKDTVTQSVKVKK